MVIILTPFFLSSSSSNQVLSAHLSLELLLNPIKDPLPAPITPSPSILSIVLLCIPTISSNVINPSANTFVSPFGKKLG